jgi:hypothetical protein
MARRANKKGARRCTMFGAPLIHLITWSNNRTAVVRLRPRRPHSFGANSGVASRTPRAAGHARGRRRARHCDRTSAFETARRVTCRVLPVGVRDRSRGRAKRRWKPPAARSGARSMNRGSCARPAHIDRAPDTCPTRQRRNDRRGRLSGEAAAGTCALPTCFDDGEPRRMCGARAHRALRLRTIVAAGGPMRTCPCPPRGRSACTRDSDVERSRAASRAPPIDARRRGARGRCARSTRVGCRGSFEGARTQAGGGGVVGAQVDTPAPTMRKPTLSTTTEMLLSVADL